MRMGQPSTAGAMRISLLISYTEHRYEGTYDNTEIRYVKNNIAKPFPFNMEAQIIHHMPSFQSVIRIAEGTSEQKCQSGP